MTTESAYTPKVRREDAATHLREKHGIPITPQRLARMAVEGTGPAFRKAGRWPLYDLPELDRFAEAYLSEPVRSTRELAPQRPRTPSATGRRLGRPPKAKAYPGPARTPAGA